MCLEFIDSKSKHTTVGYKVVDTDSSGNFFPRYQRTGKSLIKNTWMKEKDYRSQWLAGHEPGLKSSGYHCFYYRLGFHSYRKLVQAECFAVALNSPVARVLKIGVRGVTATGLQNKREVVISQEIRILKEIPCA